MFRLPVNSRVRRCLFGRDELDSDAKTDNFINVTRELIARDTMILREKYNFDGEKEEGLKGPYQWHYDSEKDIWIGKIFDVKTEIDDDDSCLSMKTENEATPRTKDEDVLPAIRKRSGGEDIAPTAAVRRRIRYE